MFNNTIFYLVISTFKLKQINIDNGNLIGLRLIIYTGKGGTGKTVTSCATAINLAERKYKTLLMSADPAHTISDALCVDIGYEIKKVLSNLDAIEIDPIVEISEKYLDIVSSMSTSFFGKGIESNLEYEIAMLPGMTQLFSLLKIEEVIKEDSYDVVVLDMAASGEALRFLYLPKIIGSMRRHTAALSNLFTGFAKMFQPFSPYNTNLDSIIAQTDILKRLENLFSVISNQGVTSLRLVTNTDNFSVKNAKRSLMSANIFGINVDLVVINKVDFDQEAKRITSEKIKLNFFPLPCKEAKYRKEELQGIEMLREHGLEIFGSDDPSTIFFEGKVYSIEEKEDSIIIKFKIPFASNAKLDIKKKYDELIISIEHDLRYITNIVTLPLAALNMRIVSSKLNDNELEIILKR